MRFCVAATAIVLANSVAAFQSQPRRLAADAVKRQAIAIDPTVPIAPPEPSNDNQNEDEMDMTGIVFSVSYIILMVFLSPAQTSSEKCLFTSYFME